MQNTAVFLVSMLSDKILTDPGPPLLKLYYLMLQAVLPSNVYMLRIEHARFFLLNTVCSPRF